MNAFVGAKKRRREFGLAKKLENEKQKRREDRKETRNIQKKELEKIKEALQLKKDMEM